MIKINLKNIKYIDTYQGGSKQPYISAAVAIEGREFKKIDIKNFTINSDELSYSASNLHSTRSMKCQADDILHTVLGLSVSLLVFNNHIIFDKYKFIEIKKNGPVQNITFHFPCFSASCLIPALRVAVALVNYAQKSNDFSVEVNKFEAEFDAMKRSSSQSFNVSHLINEALRLEITCTQVFGSIFQLGYGSKSRLFDSSHTDKTSVISAKMVKNKWATSTYLRSLGYPVAKSQLINIEADAIKFLQQSDRPVVIKPADTDGGKGVCAWLTTEEEVKQAFNVAKRFSSNLMIEEYISGCDYRVHVVNGKVHGIIKREPAAVYGDGVMSISDLIGKTNMARKSAMDDQRFLHQININPELERILHKQDMNLQSVPDRGERIVLSAAANIGLGGQPEQLEVSRAHDDNLELCIDICRLLRLDIGGVDLIISDIGESWVERGAHVCEVNSQPQMFTTFFPPLLLDVFRESRGKIPIYVMYDTTEGQGLSERVYGSILNIHVNFILVKDRQYKKSGQVIKVSLPALEVARQKLFDTDVDALLIVVNDEVNLDGGWPFSYCDCFVYDESINGDKLQKLFQA